MSAPDVAALEAALGVGFPPEVMWLLTEIGRGDLGFARVYGATQTALERLRVVDGFLAFADNGCGDLYGLPLDRREPRPVALYPHDQEHWVPSGHDDLVVLVGCFLRYRAERADSPGNTGEGPAD